MRIAVTGGAGFIGSAFVRHILKKDDIESVVVLDALTYAANMANLESVINDKRLTFIKGDIRKQSDVETMMAQHPDILINFAAESHVDRSIENPSLFIETNVNGVGVLMDAALEYGIKRFHQVSTDEVYGDTDINSTALFTETSPLNPSSPYSASKAAADLLALSYRRTYGLPVTISRCVNNYGEGQHPEKLIPMTVAKALNDEPIPIYGDGRNVREWIYCGEHSEAIEKIIRDGKDGEIYNIGSDFRISNLELVEKILSILGKSKDLITFVPDRKGHDRRYALDSSKLKRELGLSFTFSEALFEKAVRMISCQKSL